MPKYSFWVYFFPLGGILGAQTWRRYLVVTYLQLSLLTDFQPFLLPDFTYLLAEPLLAGATY